MCCDGEGGTGRGRGGEGEGRERVERRMGEGEEDGREGRRGEGRGREGREGVGSWWKEGTEVFRLAHMNCPLTSCDVGQVW